MVSNGRFRLGVGIIICNTKNEVLWAKRKGRDAWQFPQGGIGDNETPEIALYRELEEETGLTESDVQLLGKTQEWFTYCWPEPVRLAHIDPQCLGQKQRWFLLRLIGNENAISLDNTHPQEFEAWRWVDYWYPLEHIVSFKKQSYHQALHELAIYR